MYIKPQNYEISKTRNYKADPYSVENMAYDPKKDEYTCPDGRNLKFRRESKKTTESMSSLPGITVTIRVADVPTKTNVVGHKRVTERFGSIRY